MLLSSPYGEVETMAVDKFIKKWETGTLGRSLTNQIEERLRHSPPLKERVSHSIYRLNVLQSRLGQTASRMEYKNKELFEKCVNAQMAKDFDRAKIYANECSQIRNIVKVVVGSQMAIERVALRLETIQEFGDVVSTMGPVIGVVQALKGKLSGVVPEVSYELGMIGENLNELVMEVGQATGSSYSFESYGAESQKILAEASALAEQKMKDKFPELPASALPTSEKQFI